MPSPTVLISGASIAGPSLAYWLVRRGYRPILIERAPGPRTGGHAVDIRGTALDVIERMGLGQQVREVRTQLQILSAVRGAGPKTYDVALRPLHEAGGDREIEIMRDDLVRILLSAIADDVEIVYGDSIRAIADGPRVHVELHSGDTREVDLVVGADGHHSTTRALMFGPEHHFTHHLGAYLAICTVDNLLDLRDQAILYNEPGRAAAMFTVRGNERAKALLLFRSERLDVDLRDENALKTLLRKQFHGAGWETSRVLAAMDSAYDFYFDEMSQVRMPTWSTGNVVLLGDAAFGPSPLSGQGTSLALIGAYLLAHELAATPDVVGGAFRRWENSFRENVEQNQKLATQGMKVLLPASRTAIFLRNQTLRFIPLITQFGRRFGGGGFGGEIERASRAITLP